MIKSPKNKIKIKFFLWAHFAIELNGYPGH